MEDGRFSFFANMEWFFVDRMVRGNWNILLYNTLQKMFRFVLFDILIFYFVSRKKTP